MSVLLLQYRLFSKGEKAGFLRAIYCYFTNVKFRILVNIYRMQKSNSEYYRWKIRNRMELKYSLIISPKCSIGSNIQIEHFFGIVIGGNTVIGDNCKIYHQTTFGQKNGKYPIIGNNVTIFPGAKIIGNIKIGDNSVIGANAVVLHDVPSNSTAVGVPARVISKY